MCLKTLKFVFIDIDIVFIILWVGVQVGAAVKTNIPWHKWIKFFFHGATAPIGPGTPLTRLHDHIQLHTPQLVWFLWMSDQPDSKTSTWQHTALTRDRQTSIPPAAFEPTIPASELSQTHALARAATGIGHKLRIVTGNQWGVLWFYRVERNNTYRILGSRKIKYEFWGKGLVHGSVMVQLSGPSKSSPIFVSCRIYLLRMWRSTAPNQDVSGHKFLISKSLFRSSLPTLKTSWCYFNPLCIKHDVPVFLWASNRQNGRGEYN